MDFKKLFSESVGVPQSGEPAEEPWRPALKGRALVVLGLLGIWAVGIEARLVTLQVIQHDDFADRATRQQTDIIEPAANRGNILDRNGQILAYSVDANAIFATPRGVKDPESDIASLCEALGDCTADERRIWLDRFTGKKPFYMRRARAVTPQQADRVGTLGLKGIRLIDETLRFYPKFDLASHLLGFVSPDNEGLGGVEYAFDDVIRGHKGRVLVEVDARRKWIDTRVERAPTEGATLELTIDLNLQYIVERELRAGVTANRARGGTAIIMDPYSGEILAMASYPTFNPNAYWRADADDRRNRAVQEVYEPGSTFKIVTASAAIEEGIVLPSDLVDCSPGVITFGSRIIREASHHNYGVIPFQQVIEKSSNVGAIKTGLKVGAERMARYVRRFGFGEVLGGDFNAQSAGKVWNPASMSDSALASMSMGYQVSVTPLQMALAASAVANGGMLFEPHLVRAIVRDGVREAVAPKALRRAINADTAATMTTIMEGVVERGTAKAATLDRYQVAGKTGTAAKLVDGAYSTSDYNASFVGFVPSRRPALTILVVIDTPHAGPTTGGAVSAPIFKRIADSALQQLGVQPSINPTPPVVVTTAETPVRIGPATATIIPVALQVGSHATMPDVRGLDLRSAVAVLGRAGLTVRVSGNGLVNTQWPAPGEPIEPGASSSVQLQRGGEIRRSGGRP